MMPLLVLLLILSMYPTLKVLIYLPAKKLAKNKKNKTLLTIIYSLAIFVGLFLIFLLIVYLTTGYTLTNNHRMTGLEQLLIMVAFYIIGLFTAVHLLLSKANHSEDTQTQADKKSAAIKNPDSPDSDEPAETNTPDQADSKDNDTSNDFEKLLLTGFIVGFILLILFVFYIQWALTNT